MSGDDRPVEPPKEPPVVASPFPKPKLDALPLSQDYVPDAKRLDLSDDD